MASFGNSMRFAVVAVILLIGLAGCDGFTGPDWAEEGATGAARFEKRDDGAKLRHAHLLGRATTRKANTAAGKKGGGGAPGGGTGGGGTGGDGGDSTDTGLIFSLDPQRVLDRYRVMERYKAMDRYRVMERYEYENVFEGWAIWADAANLADLVAEMENDPDIAWVEPDVYLGRFLQPQGSQSGNGELLPWGVDRISALGHSAPGVELFIIDTGVSHGDVNVVEALDFRDTTLVATLDPADYDGHGTHLAALAAAIDDDDGIVGAAAGLNVHSLKVLNGDEASNGEEVEMASAIAAIEYVIGQKHTNPNTPMVINFSLGAEVGTPAYNALDLAVEAAVTSGVTVVVAAGNHGVDASTVTPAHVASAITAGAYDVYNDFAWYSNYGPLVDILAPGTDLPSLPSSTSGLDGYVLMSGTSQATALVSGAASAILAENPQASPQQVRDALVSSGQAHINGAPGGTTNLSVSLADAAAMEIPPFFRYAITSANNIIMNSGALHVGIEPGGNDFLNADIFASKNIDVSSRGNHVEGFGYYVQSLLGRNRDINGTFAPNYNPTWADVTQQVPPIVVPLFSADAHLALATQQTIDNLSLSGHYDLGTRENPTIWYVSGNLNTTGPVTTSGYGVFIVKGNVNISHDVSSLDGTEEMTLGIYAEGGLSFVSASIVVSAQIFTNGTFVLNATNSVTIYGNLTVGNADIRGPLTIYYRPASPALTELFWPMTAQKVYEGHPSSARRLLSRF